MTGITAEVEPLEAPERDRMDELWLNLMVAFNGGRLEFETCVEMWSQVNDA